MSIIKYKWLLTNYNKRNRHTNEKGPRPWTLINYNRTNGIIGNRFMSKTVKVPHA